MIHVIRDRATTQQLEEMQEMLGSYIKLAVVLYMQIVRPSFWKPEANSSISGEPTGFLQPRKFVTKR